MSALLKNTGDFEGVEVVQVYVRDLVGDITRPVKELKAFKRIKLNAGESKEITFEINTSELSFYNQEMEEVVEPGKFQLWIGGSSEATLSESFVVQ